MEVILLTNIPGLGKLAQRVQVRPGYGRNYLIPQGKALPATPENIRDTESRRQELMHLAEDANASAVARAEKLSEVTLRISRRATTEGKLFGSVSARDIAEEVHNTTGMELSKNEVLLEAGALQTTGEYEINLRLPGNVPATLRLVVVGE